MEIEQVLIETSEEFIRYVQAMYYDSEITLKEYEDLIRNKIAFLNSVCVSA